MQYIEFGKLLQKYRNEIRRTSAQVASDLGVSPAYYSRIENGKEKPSREFLGNIAGYYGLPVEDSLLLEKLAGYGTDVNSISVDTLSQVPQQAYSVKVNAETHPILFSDGMYINVSDNGVVFDFGQKLGPTNEQFIVARVGVSLSHAKKIHDLLGQQIKKAIDAGVEN